MWPSGETTSGAPVVSEEFLQKVVFLVRKVYTWAWHEVSSVEQFLFPFSRS